MGERFKWIKEHAGLWTFGILMVVLLTALCGLGAWALAAQDAKQIARNNILETNLTVEVKRLDGDIADLKNVLQAVSGKIDKLDIKIDKKIDKLDMKIDGAKKEIKDDIQRINDLLSKILIASPGTKLTIPIPPEKPNK
ncbi:MAG: hypothetical protein OXG62_00310 [Nitrospinae bacterium]|nr:hypothetical protein [Nitrospinota bacterium]